MKATHSEEGVYSFQDWCANKEANHTILATKLSRLQREDINKLSEAICLPFLKTKSFPEDSALYRMVASVQSYHE